MKRTKHRRGRFPASRFIATMSKTDQDQVNYLKLAMGITTNQVLFQVMLTSMMMAAHKLTSQEPSASETTMPTEVSNEQVQAQV